MDAAKALTALGLLACAACTTPATDVLVTLDTDAPSDRALTLLATVSTGAMGDGGNRHTWTRGGAGASVTLPASFGIVPGRGPRDGTVTLTIDATLASGVGAPALSFRRIARFAFTPHQTTRLPIFLTVSCGAAAPGCTTVAADLCTVSVRCEELGLTCGDHGACVGTMVTPQGVDGGATPVDAAFADGAVPDGATVTQPAAPTGHVGTVGAGYVSVGGRAVLDDGFEYNARTCVGTRCVSGGITP